MKDRIVAVILKTISDILAIWVVFACASNFITNYFIQYGFYEPKAVVGILSAITMMISGFLIVVLELFVFSVVFKPICIKVSFLNKMNKKTCKEKIKLLPNVNVLDVQTEYKLKVIIHGGNRLTNMLVKFLGSDLVIKYRPDAYNTEITSGWASRNVMKDLYKDSSGNMRYYWTSHITGNSVIDEEDAIELRNELVIKPKKFDVYKCNIDIELSSSKKKNIFCRGIYFIMKFFIIKFQQDALKIVLE